MTPECGGFVLPQAPLARSLRATDRNNSTVPSIGLSLEIDSPKLGADEHVSKDVPYYPRRPLPGGRYGRRDRFDGKRELNVINIKSPSINIEVCGPWNNNCHNPKCGKWNNWCKPVSQKCGNWNNWCHPIGACGKWNNWCHRSANAATGTTGATRCRIAGPGTTGVTPCRSVVPGTTGATSRPVEDEGRTRLP